MKYGFLEEYTLHNSDIFKKEYALKPVVYFNSNTMLLPVLLCSTVPSSDGILGSLKGEQEYKEYMVGSGQVNFVQLRWSSSSSGHSSVKYPPENVKLDGIGTSYIL